MFGDWLVCQTEISARPVLHVSSGAAIPTIGIIGIKSTHKVHLRHLICVPQEVTLSHWHTLIFVVCAYNSNHILTPCNETFLWQWWWFTWRYNDNDSNDDDEDDDERNPVSQSGVGSCDQIMCSSCVQQIISTLAAHSRGFTSEDFFWITWWLLLDFLVIFFGFLTEPQASALSNHCILALVTWPERPKGKKDKVQHFSVRFSIFPEHFGFLGKCWVFGERKNWIFGGKKPWNHETWRLLNVIQRWIGWNHETTKPWNHETYRLLVIQRWIGWNHETTKPWNLTSSQCPKDGLDETMKPQNHKTMKPWNRLLVIQRWIGWNNETTKPWNLSASRHPEMDWMKPWNHVDRFLGFMECTKR